MSELPLDTLAVDISRYQPGIRPDLLWDGGVRAVIMKVSQGLFKDPYFDRHVKTFTNYEKETGNRFVLGGYHWIDGNTDAGKQAKFFLDATKNTPLTIGVGDAEEWWDDPNVWLQAVTGKIPWSAVVRVKPEKAEKAAKGFMQALAQQNRLKPLCYTSEGYAQEMGFGDWLPTFDNWIAEYWYRYYPASRITVSWQTLQEKYKPLPNGSRPKPSKVKMGRLVGWQYSGDRLCLPGMYRTEKCVIGDESPSDLNVFSSEWLSCESSPAPITPPPPSEPQAEKYKLGTVIVQTLNVRSGPGTWYSLIKGKQLRAGERVKIAELRTDGWGRIAETSYWVACTYNGYTYVRF